MSKAQLHFSPLAHCSGWQRALVLGALALLAATPLCAQQLAVPQTTDCTLEPGPIRTVARILDAETVELDDGSPVRLIGALSPRASDAGATAGAWPAELDATQALTRLVLGQTVKLAYGGRHTDRYGRHLAHLFVIAGGAEKWVQGELLSAGSARAYGLPGSSVCMTELLAHERIARDQGRGLWATTVYHPKPARLAALLMSRRSRFELVEGPVVSISRSKSGVYLSFGADWKTDFTARVGKDVLAAYPDFDQKLADLKDRRVTVRGWIERRNGPMIDIRDPAQIELKDTDLDGKAISETAAPHISENASAPLQPEQIPGGALPNDNAAPKNENRPAIPEAEKPGAVDL